MLSLIRRLARRLEKIPTWIKLPLLFMQAVALLFLLTWLYFTRSVETVETPDVVGETLRQARAEVLDYGLRYRVIKRNSTRTPENRIIRQVPRPGTRIMETRQVELYVSEGPELVQVPDLTGRTLFSARNYLYRTHSRDGGQVGVLLNLGNISRVHHSDVDEEKIILQNPKAGRTVIQGSQVDLLVSKGPWPRRTVIPDLKGKKVPEARKLLGKDHLEVGKVRYILQENQPPSVVLRQTPPSGRIVQRGRPVSLTVNLSKTAQVDPIKYTYVRVTPPLSVEPGQLKVELIDRRGRRVVYNDSVKPGKEVTFLVSIRGGAKMIIYWNGDIYRFRRLEYER